MRVKAPKPIVVGLIEETTGTGFSKVTVLLPWMEGFAELVACTVTMLGVGRVAGAV
jgi:hypothetical protein